MGNRTAKSRKNCELIRKPFIGARYERNLPQIDIWTGQVLGPPPKVTILLNDITYFGQPGVLVHMPWPSDSKPPAWRKTDEVAFSLEEFVKTWHPIDNVTAFPGGQHNGTA
jgi:hypothetical protein